MSDSEQQTLDDDIENNSQKLSQLELKRLLTDSDSSDGEFVSKRKKKDNMISIDQINENSEGDSFTAMIIFKSTIHKFPNGKIVYSIVAKENNMALILSFTDINNYKELNLSATYTFTIGKKFPYF